MFSLPVPQLMNTLAILNSAAAIDTAGRCLFFMMILFPLHIYPVVGLPDHMAVLLLILFVCVVLGIEPRTSCNARQVLSHWTQQLYFFFLLF